MKRKQLILLALIFTISYGFSQDESNINQKNLDLKLQLLDSKIELFDSKLKIWETKPNEVEARLIAVNEQINKLKFDPEFFNLKLIEIESRLKTVDEKINGIEFDPEYFYFKLVEIDSLIKDYSKDNYKNLNFKRLRSLKYDTIKPRLYKTSLSLNPVKLVEGTFYLTYERAFGSKLSFSLSGLATYASEEGISNFYLQKQALEYFNAALSSYMPYYNKNISGFGTVMELRNYLLTDIYKRQKSPVGLYASGNFMFRRLWLRGLDDFRNPDTGEWEEVEVGRLLNIYAFGANIGWRLGFIKALSVDFYLGGLIKLAKYDDEDNFTRYKRFGNLDFSGVMPTFGINVGILK